ncbi:hypothetical protein VTN49DRAFT_6892 [Thermomyces lanuginosus]|uniref:uncharacterized protein n=1 Tax=Thermomyces lanuginosus TaxID=5541 RepID=UPI003742B909
MFSARSPETCMLSSIVRLVPSNAKPRFCSAIPNWPLISRSSPLSVDKPRASAPSRQSGNQSCARDKNWEHVIGPVSNPGAERPKRG